MTSNTGTNFRSDGLDHYSSPNGPSRLTFRDVAEEAAKKRIAVEQDGDAAIVAGDRYDTLEEALEAVRQM